MPCTSSMGRKVGRNSTAPFTATFLCSAAEMLFFNNGTDSVKIDRNANNRNNDKSCYKKENWGDNNNGKSVNDSFYGQLPRL